MSAHPASPTSEGNECYFCLGPAPCKRAECIQWSRDLDRDYRKIDVRDRRMAIWAAITGWCRCHDNWRLNWIERVFYTVKAVLCVLLDSLGIFELRGNPIRDKWWRWEKIDGVGLFDWSGPHGEYGIYDYKLVTVGRGWFTNWRFEIESDSSG